jgi:excisionase family DNA binding protein
MAAEVTAESASNEPKKRLYSVKEAAIYLGRTEWAVREMYYKGKIPCVRDGSRVLFDIRDLDAWIEKSKEQLAY